MSEEIGMIHMFRQPHLELVCPSCSTEHKKNWSPKFWGEVHYKTLTCDVCKYELFIRTDEFHSGHY